MKRASKFSVLKGWKLILADMGVDLPQVLKLAGLPTDLFNRAESYMTAKQYFDFWCALEESVSPRPLALELANCLSVEAFDPPIFAALCSANLNQAMSRLRQFKPLIGPLILDLSITESQTEIRLDCYGHEGSIPRSLGSLELVFFTQLARLGSRCDVQAKEVYLTELPDQLSAFSDYFGVTPQLGEFTLIVFDGEDARRPFLTENNAMWDFFEPSLKRRLSEVDTTASMADRVKSVLLEMLPGGLSSIEDAASRLAMSKRSLQRKLNAENVNFQRVLQNTREELAFHYLGRSQMSSSEISFLLGFQDTNSFYRAFNAWSGQTPETYRNNLIPANGC